MELLHNLYIRFMVWLGAAPPPRYEHLLWGNEDESSNTSMNLTKVEVSTIDKEVRFVLWVWCWDEWREKDRPYSFKWTNEKVIFMFGGWKGEPRIIGHAKTQDEAQKVAELWLETWLKECGAL